MLQISRSAQRDKIGGIARSKPITKTEPPPRLTPRKIGIVSRDYNRKYRNGFRDFSAAFDGALRTLDEEGCDTVVFSLYSIVPRKGFRPFKSVHLQNVRSVLYQEFIDGRKREGGPCLVFYRRANKWHRYCLPVGGIPKLRGSKKAKQKRVEEFKREAMPGRILGNCCAILCGEINCVPYHPSTGRVGDDFGLRRSIPPEVTVVLNPGHDWMSRFEMPLKRKFLSQQGRWVISLWNKGKRGKNRKPRDAKGDPWTIFHDGREVCVEPEENHIGVYIGIVETGEA